MDANTSSIGYLWAAILGLVQGVAEFLPISSSGHLALVQHLGMETPAPAALDVFLHLATLLVVIFYFRRTIFWYYRNDLRVLMYIVAATVPVGVIGMLFKDYFEALRESPNIVCLGLLITAIGLTLAHVLKHAGAYQLRDLGWFGAIVVGMCQALALTPGISRSGSTIAGAVICGVDREEAFSFSFILSIPAIMGAVFLHARGFAKDGFAVFGGIAAGPLALAFVIAAASGYLALSLLDRIVARGNLIWFAGYCLAVSLLGFVYFNLIV